MTPLFSPWIKSNRFYLVLSLIIGLSIKSISAMDHTSQANPAQQSTFYQSCFFALNTIKTGFQRFSNALTNKIPHKMQKPFYWTNSSINGIKTNAAFAAFATVAYPLNLVNGKNALILQSLFLAKNIICLQMFTNNIESDYCNDHFSFGGQYPTNGTFLNGFIAPYSLILLIAGLSYGGVKQIAQFASTTTAHSVIFNRFM